MCNTWAVIAEHWERYSQLSNMWRKAVLGQQAMVTSKVPIEKYDKDHIQEPYATV